MSSRLEHITKIGVEQMGDLADSLKDPEVLRMENLDTDVRPPENAVKFTQKAAEDDNANSYLPFLGLDATRQACTDLVNTHASNPYNWKTECVISAGGLSGILNVLLAVLEPGDEVLMTDPTYVGLINRVRLAGGVPRFVPLVADASGWHVETDQLKQMQFIRLRALLLMSPSMPSGCVFTKSEWDGFAELCLRQKCWMIYDSAMERLLYDNLKLIHPATYDDLHDHLVTCGSASKEYRMIGWRVGWQVGPAKLMADVARVSISNVVCQTGIAMGAVAVAIRDPNDGIAEFAAELQKRRDLLLSELAAFPVIKPSGGWSLLIDMSKLGMDGATASKKLLEKGKVAATAMVNWGPDAGKYLRLVYSNEPTSRLRGIGKRFSSAFG